MKVTIWCYDCGAKWERSSPAALYKELSRCPIVTGTAVCNGYTDGVQQ